MCLEYFWMPIFLVHVVMRCYSIVQILGSSFFCCRYHQFIPLRHLQIFLTLHRPAEFLFMCRGEEGHCMSLRPASSILISTCCTRKNLAFACFCAFQLLEHVHSKAMAPRQPSPRYMPGSWFFLSAGARGE